MAKAISPIRLQNELMESAKAVGALMHRSAAEQIEYWASLGQKVSELISPQTLLSINAGLVKIAVEPVVDSRVDFDDVLGEVQMRSASGELSQIIANGKTKYQASVSHPGLLEQIEPNGTVTVGMFKNGEFVAELSND
ncbi:MAG: ParD-like family protein [Psychrosphaera sp.]|nr:ParD-like family protein [Psychrosphaera sp.]